MKVRLMYTVVREMRWECVFTRILIGWKLGWNINVKAEAFRYLAPNRHIFGGWKMRKVQYWFHIRIYIYVQINISFCIKFDLCKITCHHLAAGYKALPKTLNCSFQCNINLPMHVVDHTSSSSCVFTICAIASDAVNYTTLPKNIAKHRDISFALTS